MFGQRSSFIRASRSLAKTGFCFGSLRVLLSFFFFHRFCYGFLYGFMSLRGAFRHPNGSHWGAQSWFLEARGPFPGLMPLSSENQVFEVLGSLECCYSSLFGAFDFKGVLWRYFWRNPGHLSGHGPPTWAPLGHLWDLKCDFITLIFRSGFPGGSRTPKRLDFRCFGGVFGECFEVIFLEYWVCSQRLQG